MGTQLHLEKPLRRDPDQEVSGGVKDSLIYGLYWRPGWGGFQIIVSLALLGIGETQSIRWLSATGGVLFIWASVAAPLLRPLIRNQFSAVNHNTLGFSALNSFLSAGSGNADLALAEFTQAISMAPNWAMPYNNRALMYAILKNFDLAIKDATEALRLDPYYSRACLGLGAMYKDIGQYDKAIEYLEMAQSISATVPGQVGDTMEDQLYYANYLLPRLAPVEAIKEEICECNRRKRENVRNNGSATSAKPEDRAPPISAEHVSGRLLVSNCSACGHVFKWTDRTPQEEAPFCPECGYDTIYDGKRSRRDIEPRQGAIASNLADADIVACDNCGQTNRRTGSSADIFPFSLSRCASCGKSFCAATGCVGIITANMPCPHCKAVSQYSVEEYRRV